MITHGAWLSIGLLVTGAALLVPLGRKLDRLRQRGGGWTEPWLWVLGGLCILAGTDRVAAAGLPMGFWFAFGIVGVWSLVLVVLLDLLRSRP